MKRAGARCRRAGGRAGLRSRRCPPTTSHGCFRPRAPSARRAHRRRDARGRGILPGPGRRCDDAPRDVGVRAAPDRRAMHAHHAPPGALFCVGVADDDRPCLRRHRVARGPDARREPRSRGGHARVGSRRVHGDRGGDRAALGYRRLVSYTLLGKTGRPTAPQVGHHGLGRGVAGVALAPRAHDDAGRRQGPGGDGTGRAPGRRRGGAGRGALHRSRRDPSATPVAPAAARCRMSADFARLGAEIRARRESLGLSLRELARRADLSPSTLSPDGARVAP